MQEQTDIELNEPNASYNQGPVTCLGMTFDSDEDRHAWFAEELRKKLQDPEFRKIEGFPIGDDEAILAMSDPPYYTACPNPWITDFIEQWEEEKPLDRESVRYRREPFAADVSEGRSGLFYDAHSYHTKVPHKAIMRFILHYTNPGDVVLDTFCGTGMTGVAAQLCGDSEAVASLGYQVCPDGTILKKELNPDGGESWIAFSTLGVRHAVLNDLSPAATFISYNLNTPISALDLKVAATVLLDQIEKEYGWIYETIHNNCERGKINYVIWSDIYRCPICSEELIFWDAAVDHGSLTFKKTIECTHCGAHHHKRHLERVWRSEYSSIRNKVIKKAKQSPVLINYTVAGRRHEKRPDQQDIALIEKINQFVADLDYGLGEIPDGFNTRQPKASHGVWDVSDFYTKRNLYALLLLRQKVPTGRIGRALQFLINSYDLSHSTLMTRIIFKNSGKKPVLTGYQSGTLYISSMPVEKNIFQGIRKQKLPIILRSLASVEKQQLMFTGSACQTGIGNATVDYLFLDPPFGANIMYSEVNLISESWLGVLTNSQSEAIENKVANKSLYDYRTLMAKCFAEAYRVLKKGRWMTVEFSNTKSAVWNSIQTALTDAGFIVANVSALDKQQGSFKAVTTPTAVKQDLVISAYKPNGGFEERFLQEAQTEEGAWDFVRTHLGYLPITKLQQGEPQFIPERDPRILFDQVVAYYVRKGYPVPLSSQEFQAGLPQRFVERDGMYFLSEQIAEYDRNKMISGELGQMNLFVSDEASAIRWLRQLLKQKPQTFADINPQFMQQLGGWKKSEIQMDLRELLEQNFLSYNGKADVPEQVHAYLSSNWKDMRNRSKDDPELMAKAKDRWYVPDPNKAGDLEQLRERALLKEFENYKAASRKLKKFRLEALRAGFKKAWQNRDYETITHVAEKIPSKVLEEDPKLLMWYDQAVTRLGGQ